ncbi:MAG TPA: type II secretion system protein [Tepidisphaeraceae bacterium]|nr:type II secretion system protein [Tepidisphaeraceae bacterium]
MSIAGRKPRTLSRRTSRSAFTLIEVLVTMGLMGIVLPVAMRGISISIAAASYARHAAEASTLGQSKLNEIVASLMNTQSMSVSDSGDFGPAWPDYTYRSTQTYDSDLLLTTVTLTVIWNERGQQRTMDLTTMVADPLVT